MAIELDRGRAAPLSQDGTCSPIEIDLPAARAEIFTMRSCGKIAHKELGRETSQTLSTDRYCPS
jgi:hypothetical protein